MLQTFTYIWVFGSSQILLDFQQRKPPDRDLLAIWTNCWSFVLLPVSRDWDSGQFGFAKTNTLLYHTVCLAYSQMFFDRFISKPLQTDLIGPFVEKVGLCRIREALRIHLTGDGIFPLFWRCTCREPSTEPLVRFGYFGSWAAKIAKSCQF